MKLPDDLDLPEAREMIGRVISTLICAMVNHNAATFDEAAVAVLQRVIQTAEDAMVEMGMARSVAFAVLAIAVKDVEREMRGSAPAVRMPRPTLRVVQ